MQSPEMRRSYRPRLATSTRVKRKNRPSMEPPGPGMGSPRQHIGPTGQRMGRRGQHLRPRGQHLRPRGQYKGRPEPGMGSPEQDIGPTRQCMGRQGQRMGRRGQRMGRRGQRMGRRGQHLRHSGRHKGSPGPDMEPPEPDMGYPEPDMGYPEPDMGYPEPDMGYPEPDMGYPEPDMGYPEPGMGYPEPGMGYPEQDIEPPGQCMGRRGLHLRPSWQHKGPPEQGMGYPEQDIQNIEPTGHCMRRRGQHLRPSWQHKGPPEPDMEPPGPDMGYPEPGMGYPEQDIEPTGQRMGPTGHRMGRRQHLRPPGYYLRPSGQLKGPPEPGMGYPEQDIEPPGQRMGRRRQHLRPSGQHKGPPEPDMEPPGPDMEPPEPGMGYPEQDIEPTGQRMGRRGQHLRPSGQHKGPPEQGMGYPELEPTGQRLGHRGQHLRPSGQHKRPPEPGMGPLRPSMRLPGPGMGPPGQHMGPSRQHMEPSGQHMEPSGQHMGPSGQHMRPTGHMGSHGPGMEPSGQHKGPPEQHLRPSGQHMGPPEPGMGPLGPSMGPPGPGMGPPGQHIGTSGQQMEPSGHHIGPPVPGMEPSGQHMGPSGQHMGPSGLHMGSHGPGMEPSGQHKGPSRQHIGPSGQYMGPLGSGMEPPRPPVPGMEPSGQHMGPSGLHMGSHGPGIEPSGQNKGPSGQHIGPSGQHMGPLGSGMEPPRPGIGPPGHHMGPSVQHFGSTGPREGPPGQYMGPPGQHIGPSVQHIKPHGPGMEPPGPGMGPPGQHMGTSEPRIGPSWQHTGPSGQHVGPPGPGMGPSGQHMEPPGQHIGPPGQHIGPPGQHMGPSGQHMGPSGQQMGSPGPGMGPSGPGMVSSGPGMGPPRQVMESLEQHMGPSGHHIGPPGQHTGLPGQGMGPRGQHMEPSGQHIGPSGQNIGPSSQHMGHPGPGMGPPGPNMGPTRPNTFLGMSVSQIGSPRMPPIPQKVQPVIPNYSVPKPNLHPVQPVNLLADDNLWVETVTPTGQVYYYHSKTRVSSWERPQNVNIVTHAELEIAHNRMVQGSTKTGISECDAGSSVKMETSKLEDKTSQNNWNTVCKPPQIAVLQPKQAEVTEWTQCPNPKLVIDFLKTSIPSALVKPQVLVFLKERNMATEASQAQTSVQQNAAKDVKTDNEVSFDESEEEAVEKKKKQPKITEEKKPELKPEQKPEWKPEPKAERKPEPKAEQKPVPKAEQKPVPKAEQKPVPKAEQKPVPKAEQKPEPEAEQKPERKPEPKAEQKPEPEAEQKPEQKPERKPEPKAEQKPEPEAEQKPEQKPVPKAEQKPERKPEPKAEQKPEPEAEQKAVAKSRPVARTPIPGTVWCVVQTNDGKHFFYNPTKRQSVWKMPEELKNRPDVEKLLPPKPEVKTEKMEEKDQQEEPPSKKIKLETEVKEEIGKSSSEVVQQTVLEKETPNTVKVQPAENTPVVSLEDRKKQFKELLAEKNLSTSSTWEKELHKVVFDKNYMLLTSRERKQAFEEYVKDRAEEERKERNRLAKENSELFRHLLEESNLNVKSTFTSFSNMHSHDRRFRLILRPRVREQMFEDYIKELAQQEKEENSLIREKAKIDFMKMLSETPGIAHYTLWRDVSRKLYSDPRYKAVHLESQRNYWYNEYLRNENDVKSDFRKMLSEIPDIGPSTIWGDVKNKVSSDPRYKAVSDTRREEWFKMYLKTVKDVKSDFMKMLSEIPGINRITSWKDVKNKVRSDPRYEAAVSDYTREDWFMAHLKTLKDVKSDFMKMLSEIPGLNRSTSWSEVKNKVSSDPRYEAAVSDYTREDWFMAHLKTLKDVKSDFMKMLSEIPGINRSTSWKDVKNKVSSDPRYEAAVSDYTREDWFMAHLKTLKDVKSDFMKMLSEIPGLNRSTSWKDVKNKVSSDPRYEAAVSDYTREDWFMAHLKTLKDVKSDFMKMLSEIPGINRSTSWKDVKNKVSSDPRYEAAVSDYTREDWFMAHLKTLKDVTPDNTRKKEEQSKSLNASSVKEKDESKKSQRGTANDDFNKFLVEKVTNSEGSFNSFKSKFDADPNWTKKLTDEEKKKLYDSHVDEIHKKNREILWSILDGINLSLVTVWDTVKDKVQKDPRFVSYTDSEKKQAKEYAVYMHKKYLKAKEDFRELLKETKFITSKTKAMLGQRNFSLINIEHVMRNDSRFTALTCIHEQREQMILEYVNELSEKTQPPHR